MAGNSFRSNSIQQVTSCCTAELFRNSRLVCSERRIPVLPLSKLFAGYVNVSAMHLLRYVARFAGLLVLQVIPSETDGLYLFCVLIVFMLVGNFCNRHRFGDDGIKTQMV